MRVAKSVLGLASVSVLGSSLEDAKVSKPETPITGEAAANQKSTDGTKNRYRAAFGFDDFPLRVI